MSCKLGVCRISYHILFVKYINYGRLHLGPFRCRVHNRSQGCACCVRAADVSGEAAKEESSSARDSSPLPLPSTSMTAGLGQLLAIPQQAGQQGPLPVSNLPVSATAGGVSKGSSSRSSAGVGVGVGSSTAPSDVVWVHEECALWAPGVRQVRTLHSCAHNVEPGS